MWAGCRSPSFSSCIPSSSSDVIPCSPVSAISSVHFPSQIHTGGLYKRNQLDPHSVPAQHPRSWFSAMVGLNCVMRSTMCICRPLQSADSSKNDSQSQKLEGAKYTPSWSPSSQKLEGTRHTHGSNRTDKHTERPRYMCDYRPHLTMCTVMRPKQINQSVEFRRIGAALSDNILGNFSISDIRCKRFPAEA